MQPFEQRLIHTVPKMNRQCASYLYPATQANQNLAVIETAA